MFDVTQFLLTLTNEPGVYCMRDSTGNIIYVGKAKNLKKRVSSYFRSKIENGKTRVMVRQIRDISITVTHSETEALILEHNLIKAHKPRYNVVLRDDKTYPHLLITQHLHPRLMLHRGAKKQAGSYFGPYPSGSAVNDSLQLMQKLFPVRQCQDSYYNNRSRPCLQYQIKRCLGPCCNKCTDEEYMQQVELAQLFLKGKNEEVISRLVAEMEAKAKSLDYEQAARIRDQIQSLRKVQEQNAVTGSGDELDVLAFVYEQNIAIVHLLMIRKGQVLGSRSFKPKVPASSRLDEIQHAFILQYYLNEQNLHSMPKEVLLEILPPGSEEIEQLLSANAGFKVSLKEPKRGDKKRYLNLAKTNVYNDFKTQLSHKTTHTKRFAALKALLNTGKELKRLECYDISHTFGEKTVASCVVFNHSGPVKSEYRRFNIEGIRAGDDYAAMAQVIKRRFEKAEELDNFPDIVFIDGGKGQLNACDEQLSHMNLIKPPLLIGIAKGITRKPGLETLIIGAGGQELNLSVDDDALLLIQNIRDESHRFAITGHRNKRDKARKESVIEKVPGVGAKRRQALLKHLGGMQELKRASVNEIAKVPGISQALAELIHQHLH